MSDGRSATSESAIRSSTMTSRYPRSSAISNGIEDSPTSTGLLSYVRNSNRSSRRMKRCRQPLARKAISRLVSVGNTAVWYKAQFYYDLVTTMDSAEATVKEFAAVCPPFLALIYAVFLPWYNNAVRDPETGERVIAGSNDLYMSAYLPYVDMFVTDDEDQEKALREVARLAKLETKILSYDDFCAALPVSV
jgi:hypothetical protein